MVLKLFRISLLAPCPPLIGCHERPATRDLKIPRCCPRLAFNTKPWWSKNTGFRLSPKADNNRHFYLLIRLFRPLLLILAGYAYSFSSNGFNPGFKDSLGMEYLQLENIRFKYDIEGDRNASVRKLKNLVHNSVYPAIQAQACFFLGKIYDYEFLPDSAVAFFECALREPGLIKEELNYLRLMVSSIKKTLAIRSDLDKIYQSMDSQFVKFDIDRLNQLVIESH